MSIVPYVLLAVVIIGYVVLGTFEWNTGSKGSARWSWIQGLLIFGGVIAFAGPAPGLVALARVILGLAVVVAGIWFINQRYARNNVDAARQKTDAPGFPRNEP